MDEVKKERVRQIVKDIRALMQVEDFDGCLRAFQCLEDQRPLTPGDLVVKSRCFQLTPGKAASLERAEECLRAALDLDDEYIPALIELGWFHYAIQDDAKTGLAYFVKAEELGHLQLKEATEGKEKCQLEIREDKAMG
jgi:hypothetical protein